MLTLYGAMASRAHRSIWMLKELGVAFRHEPVDFLDGNTRTPEFLAINPNGRVPVLRDDDFVVYESMAINLYLARRYGDDLGPRDWREDALATQWSFWVVTEVEKPLLLASANRALFAPEGRRETEAQIALRKLARPWTVLDQHLSRQPWLLGERFTVADLNVATVMDLAPQCAISLDPWPRLQAWHQRCLARPAASDWRDVTFSVPRPADALGMLAMFV
ncbi:glutathione S-transferase family protein [Paraburkholderia kururiensis]|uniref:Glutathione S-transferase family protein n=1 Tax=Paraburkholderia kururiensis TaxID=984307 RepID=A0ABZ0WNW0_9BURK|nr:glutathione S-transferase family protein [Paraburkholderia kururiensis]WQD79079.1 glutathione S-transferase family protein [Paraburkholderia kururiensis]